MDENNDWPPTPENIDRWDKIREEIEKYIKDNPFSFRGLFNPNNEEYLCYLDYSSGVTIKDAYRVYKTLISNN